MSTPSEHIVDIKDGTPSFQNQLQLINQEKEKKYLIERENEIKENLDKLKKLYSNLTKKFSTINFPDYSRNKQLFLDRIFNKKNTYIFDEALNILNFTRTFINSLEEQYFPIVIKLLEKVTVSITHTEDSIVLYKANMGDNNYDDAFALYKNIIHYNLELKKSLDAINSAIIKIEIESNLKNSTYGTINAIQKDFEEEIACFSLWNKLHFWKKESQLSETPPQVKLSTLDYGVLPAEIWYKVFKTLFAEYAENNQEYNKIGSSLARICKRFYALLEDFWRDQIIELYQQGKLPVPKREPFNIEKLSRSFRAIYIDLMWLQVLNKPKQIKIRKTPSEPGITEIKVNCKSNGAFVITLLLFAATSYFIYYQVQQIQFDQEFMRTFNISSSSDSLVKQDIKRTAGFGAAFFVISMLCLIFSIYLTDKCRIFRRLPAGTPYRLDDFDVKKLTAKVTNEVSFIIENYSKEVANESTNGLQL